MTNTNTKAERSKRQAEIRERALASLRLALAFDELLEGVTKLQEIRA